MQARSAELKIIYNGVDISEDISKFLISASYCDNADGKADDFNITLEDKSGLWRGDWLPEKGAGLQASIIARNFDLDREGVKSLSLGDFKIDELEISGWPSVVNIKATSTDAGVAMRTEKKTQAWENIKISGIASEIAARNNLNLIFDGGEQDILLTRQDQINTPDLKFLSALANKYGLACKVDNKKLVIFSQEDYENKSAAGVINLNLDRVINFKLNSKLAGTFKSAKVFWHDPVANENLTGEASGGGEVSGENLIINARAQDADDAKKIAAQALHNANKREISGSLTLVGDLNYSAGQNVELRGFGKFDGKYFCERVTQNLSGGGFVTSLEIRRGGENSGAKKNKSAGQKFYWDGASYHAGE